MVPNPPHNQAVRATRLLRFRAWPLSAQVMLALAVALLPLGALAILAAIDNYRNMRASEAELVSSRLVAFERTVQGRLEEDFALLRAEILSDVSSPLAREDCNQRLSRLAELDAELDSMARVDANGQLICASIGAPLPRLSETGPAWQNSRRGRLPRAVIIDEAGPDRGLILALRQPATGDTIVGRISRRSLQKIIPTSDLGPEDRVRLLRYGEVLSSWGMSSVTAVPELDRIEDGELRRYTAADGHVWLYGVKDLNLPGFRLLVMRQAAELSFPRALTTALPILMWLAAVFIAWLAIRALVVQPLAQVRRSLERYAVGNADLRLSDRNLRTQEVQELGESFDRMADQINRHEEDLRTALATQKKLTREVHHRVKNNLQIVSSLLSLQSRDASSPEVAYAYGTIQKRVNALALVHRWLYDDEAMRGVDLRSLAQDLCAGLEQSTTTPNGASISIAADVDRVYVGQDTAVPLAFLITELVTAAARLNDGTPLSVRTTAKARDGRGVLTVEATSFRGEDRFAVGSGDPSARIIQGMARQMRSKLAHQVEQGSYSIEFPIAP